MRWFIALLACAAIVRAEEPGAEHDERMRRLEDAVRSGNRKIEELERRLHTQSAAQLEDEVQRYLASSAAGHDHDHGAHGVVEVSLDLLIGGGGSTANNDELGLLQGGAHDPRRRGFTFQQMELSVSGELEDVLRGEAHLIVAIDPLEGETIVELEEAFVLTLGLPFGLEVEAGHFFTEFGIRNTQHPHAWTFVDTPAMLSRVFGGDGMRAPGFRIGWTPEAAPFLKLHFGMQNAEGETMVSFNGTEEFDDDERVRGRPFVERDIESLSDFVYLVRIEARFERETWTGVFGLSGLFGPNYTGPDGFTAIYGFDARIVGGGDRDLGENFWVLQIEVLGRSFEADAFDDGVDVFAEETFDDLGLYIQFLYGFHEDWSAGFRFGYASADDDTSADPGRADRRRYSLLAVYEPVESARLRFQVNADRADAVGDDTEFTFWIVLDIGLGHHDH